MAVSQPYAGAGLLPSATLAPYGKEILKAGIGQLGTPIDVGALTPKIAGQTAFQQKGAQRLADMYGMGDIQRDATGQVTGFTGGTGIASYQPYLDQISQQQLLDPATGYQAFMSPYQKEIIDTTMQEYDIQAGRGRQAISDANTAGGGNIIFDVSGVINLNSILGFGSNITISGQTAPIGGITLDGERVYVADADNLIVRYIRFRGGIDGNNDSVTIHT